MSIKIQLSDYGLIELLEYLKSLLEKGYIIYMPKVQQIFLLIIAKSVYENFLFEDIMIIIFYRLIPINSKPNEQIAVRILKRNRKDLTTFGKIIEIY